MKKEVLFQKFQGRNSKNVVKNPEQKGKNADRQKLCLHLYSRILSYTYTSNSSKLPCTIFTVSRTPVF